MLDAIRSLTLQLFEMNGIKLLKNVHDKSGRNRSVASEVGDRTTLSWESWK